jgi:hypothetical protein
MALYYCQTHQRLWAPPAARWTTMPAALIAQITALYHRLPLPEFAVIAAPCDQCAPGEGGEDCGGPGDGSG